MELPDHNDQDSKCYFQCCTIPEFKYLQNKEWYQQAVKSTRTRTDIEHTECFHPLRLGNIGLVSSRDILTSWGQGASLALVGHPCSGGIVIQMPYGVDVLHQPASHPIFSYWVG